MEEIFPFPALLTCMGNICPDWVRPRKSPYSKHTHRVKENLKGSLGDDLISTTELCLKFWNNWEHHVSQVISCSTEPTNPQLPPLLETWPSMVCCKLRVVSRAVYECQTNCGFLQSPLARARWRAFLNLQSMSEYLPSNCVCIGWEASHMGQITRTGCGTPDQPQPEWVGERSLNPQSKLKCLPTNLVLHVREVVECWLSNRG